MARIRYSCWAAAGRYTAGDGSGDFPYIRAGRLWSIPGITIRLVAEKSISLWSLAAYCCTLESNSTDYPGRAVGQLGIVRLDYRRRSRHADVRARHSSRRAADSLS
jgi:hypothetical protein